MAKKKIRSDDQALNAVMDFWNNIIFPYLSGEFKDELRKDVKTEVTAAKEELKQDIYNLHQDVVPHVKDHETRITKLESVLEIQ